MRSFELWKFLSVPERAEDIVVGGGDGKGLRMTGAGDNRSSSWMLSGAIGESKLYSNELSL